MPRRKPCRPRSVWPALIALGATTALAGIPEPGARLYGTIALEGVVVTAADTAVVIEARTTPTADPDGDGRPNSREFLQGTNPNVADGRHPSDLNPADDRITLQEVTDYILAWKTGGTWPIEPALTAPNIEDYITRAGALWKGGELYLFDKDPVTTAPLWWVNPSPVIAAGRGAQPAANSPSPDNTLRVARAVPTSYQPNQPVPVTIDVTPTDGTKAYAVVETPPEGWTVRNLSHEGRWKALQRKIKWGPYFDQTPRTFKYDVVPKPGASGPARFIGRGSFDGYGMASTGPLRLWPTGQVPPARLEAAMASAVGVAIELHGEPGRSYELQVSDDLGSWQSGPTLTLSAEGRSVVPAGAGTHLRFYRLRPLP